MSEKLGARAGDDGTVDRPIIILGAPRSGTTILSRVLEAHPQLVRIGEPRLTWRYGNETKSDMLRPRDLTPEIRSHIRGRFAEEARSAGKPRFVEKSPQNSLRVEYVASVFPEARFVHILRDGRDSTISIRDHWLRFSGGIVPLQLRRRLREIEWRRAPHYLTELLRRTLPTGLAPVVGQRTWGPRIPGLEQLLRDLDLIEVCALQWRMCVEAACVEGRQLSRDRYMECRLEEFSPELVKKVLDFCELDTDPAVKREIEGRYDVGRRVARSGEVTSDEMRQVLHWIEPTLKWLGYPI